MTLTGADSPLVTVPSVAVAVRMCAPWARRTAVVTSKLPFVLVVPVAMGVEPPLSYTLTVVPDFAAPLISVDVARSAIAVKIGAAGPFTMVIVTVAVELSPEPSVTV
jgi:hypothetical protein